MTIRRVLLVSAFTPVCASGQLFGDTLLAHFDDPSATLVVEPIQPQSIWQIGPPDKSVFLSAWSTPNVLVTDTVLPYPPNSASFAEFNIALEEPGLGLDFRSRVHTEGPGSYGRLETYDPTSQQWEPVTSGWLFTEYDNLHVVAYTGSTDDEGRFFGTDTGWVPVHLEAYCVGVFRPDEERVGGGASYITRLRFAFYSGDTEGGYDGWMIDDLMATAIGCSGGLEETPKPTISLTLDPAATTLTVSFSEEMAGMAGLQIFASDGRRVLVENFRGDRSSVDVASLEAGSYACAVHRNGLKFAKSFVITR